MCILFISMIIIGTKTALNLKVRLTGFLYSSLRAPDRCEGPTGARKQIKCPVLVRITDNDDCGV